MQQEDENSLFYEPWMPVLCNAIEEAFANSRVKHWWANKLGVYPRFNQAALKDPKFCHERVVDATGAADDSVDPLASFLQARRQHNVLPNTGRTWL